MPLGVKVKLLYLRCSFCLLLVLYGAVGYDLYSSEDATVPCQAGRALVSKKGIALSITDGLVRACSPSFWSSCEALHQRWCGCY